METRSRQAATAAVVVTWNSAADISECLASAVAAGAAEIVVVDNGSTDGTVLRVQRDFPHVRVLAQDHNVGFAVGCNIGIAATTAPYVLMLNADARLASDYLQWLLPELEANRRAASAVGKLVFERGGKRYIDSAGIWLRRYALAPLDRGHRQEDRGQYDKAAVIFGPSAAAAVYRRSALLAVGPEIFDASLFAYYEDVDLAWRLGNHGFCHLYVPAAVAFHERRGPDTKPRPIRARAFVNRYAVFRKNESLWRFATYSLLALPWEGARLLRRGVKEPGFVLEIARQLGKRR